MKALRVISSGLAAAMIFSASMTAKADPVQLKIASFRQGSSYYVYAVTIGELLRGSLPQGSVIDTPPIGGGVANPALVGAGKADLALSFSVSNAWAKKGIVAFDKPIDNVRALVGGLDQYYGIVLANGAGIDGDVKSYLTKTKPDARIIMLPKGSTGYYLSYQLFGLIDADPDALGKRGGTYNYGSFGVVKDGFANKSMDLFAHTVTVGHPAVTEIALNNKVSYLQLSAETLNGMSEKYGWDVATLPANSFKGQDIDLRLPATTTVLIARADLSDDLAYLITKTICENVDRLVAGHKALAKFDPATRAWKPNFTGIELHPGAMKYYKERGWM